MVEVALDDALLVGHALCGATVDVHPQCFEELGVLMRAVILGAKLGAPEIGVDVVLDELLDQLLSFFSRVYKPLVCIPANAYYAVPAFWR